MVGSSIADALRTTSKGKLKYDRTWKSENKVDVPDHLNQSISLCVTSANEINNSIFSIENLSLGGSHNSNHNISNRVQHNDECGRYNETLIRNLSFSSPKPNRTNNHRLSSPFHVQTSTAIKPTHKNRHLLSESGRSILKPIQLDQKIEETFQHEDHQQFPHLAEKLSLEVENILLNYESQRHSEMRQRIENRFNQIRAHFDELDQNYEERDNLIRQKYLLVCLQRSKQYNQDFNSLLEQILTRPNSFTKEADANAKLQRIEEAHVRRLEEQRQKKNAELSLKIKTQSEKIRALINQQFELCKQKGVNSEHVRPLGMLTSLANSVELILTKENLTEDDLTSSVKIYKEAHRVEQVCRNAIDNTGQLPKQVTKEPTLKPIESQQRSIDTAKEESKENVQTNRTIKTIESELCHDRSIGEFYATAELNGYLSSQRFKMELEMKIESFVKDPSTKNYRNDITQFIKTTINAISSNSYDHLKEKILRLSYLFEGKSIEFRDQRINVNGHPDALDFAMHLTATTFLTVGLKQVISIAKSAYPLSAVMVVLWARFPVFGKILLAQFHDKCPYIVPFYRVKDKSLNDIEYLLACGYSQKGDGTLETEESFLNKMRALIRLYGAIIQSNVNNQPLGLQVVWRWLASILSMEPQAKITPAVLHAFLNTTHHRLFTAYRKQYIKLINFISKEYMARMVSVYTKEDNRQSLTQLETYLETIRKEMKSGQLPEMPEGYIKNIPESF